MSSPASPRTVTAGPISTEALARLDYLLSLSDGCAVLLGPPHSGKSALLRELAIAATRTGALVAHIDGHSLDSRGLMWELAAMWQIAPASDGHNRRLTQTVRDYIHGAVATGLKPAILLDHADRLEHTGALSLARLLHECSGRQSPMLLWAADSPLQGDASELLLPLTQLRIDCPQPTVAEVAAYAQAAWQPANGEELSPPLAEQVAGLSRNGLRRAERLSRLSQLAALAEGTPLDRDMLTAVAAELV